MESQSSPSPGKFAEYSKEFYLKEYETIRAQIDTHRDAYLALERYVVVAIGASWAWLINQHQGVPQWAWFAPFLFAVLGGMRAVNNLKFFKAAYWYSAQLEASFSGPDDPGGWERSSAKSRHSSTTTTALVFWALLLAATLGVAIYEISRH